MLATKHNQHIHVVGMGGTMKENSSSLFALRHALRAAENIGATTELLDLRALDLPMYKPGLPLEAYGPSAAGLVESVSKADAMFWSTAAYHGTLAGVTKNAIDFLQFLSEGDKPYLQDKVVGLIATAGGDMAAVNTTNTMVHAVHALRGIVAPLLVPIPQAWRVIKPEEAYIDKKWDRRLEQLGHLVVTTVASLQQELLPARI